MGGTFSKYLFSRRSNCLHIQLAEQVDQQNVEYVAGTTSRVRPGAGVELLGNLLVQIETPNR